jgi:outer membrane protein OmpA-like peptidoglycan-associated protein
VAAIFAAYPKVHAKIGGYTDNTGDARANQTLSQDRANSVMDQLVSLGIDKGRLEAEGYGDQHPVADNATEAGRAQNRRIALRITEK